MIHHSYTYTNQDRSLAHVHQIGQNGILQLLVLNEYNELGQLISKNVGGSDVGGNYPLQKVDYSYNIRGWLKGINDVGTLNQQGQPQDLFSFKINYETVEHDLNGQVRVQYNGNISESFWRTASDDTKRSYGYSYDHLNRLGRALYRTGNEGLWTSSYDERILPKEAIRNFKMPCQSVTVLLILSCTGIKKQRLWEST